MMDQSLARNDAAAVVQGLVPGAGSVLSRVISGAIRAPAAVRAGIAMRVIELASKPPAVPPAPTSAMAEALGAVRAGAGASCAHH